MNKHEGKGEWRAESWGYGTIASTFDNHVLLPIYACAVCADSFRSYVVWFARQQGGVYGQETSSVSVGRLPHAPHHNSYLFQCCFGESGRGSKRGWANARVHVQTVPRLEHLGYTLPPLPTAPLLVAAGLYCDQGFPSQWRFAPSFIFPANRLIEVGSNGVGPCGAERDTDL